MKKLDNYSANLAILNEASLQDLSNDFVTSGIINKFSIQFELAWKLLRATLEYEGVSSATSGSPRQIIKSAYATYDFIDEALWLEMLQARNELAHIYDGEMAQELIARILDSYIPEFNRLQNELVSLYESTLFVKKD